jgi:putative flippase GtrA
VSAIARLEAFAGRPARFVLSGAVVAVCHFTIMTLLVTVAGLPAQASLALAYALALTLHFTLNRQFVFASRHGYTLHLSAQGRRYVLVAALSYAVTAAAVAVVPRLLDVSPLVAFYAAAAVQAVITFLLLRHWVFRSPSDLEVRQV